MSTNIAMPGVYIEEIPKFPPSVAQVETAIPAFVGYTQFRLDKNGNALPANTPVRIKSLTEFERYFGIGPRITVSQVRLDANNNFLGADISASNFYLYDALRLFYVNGGGDCYIVSIGAIGFSGPPSDTEINSGITAIEKVDEPTIILFPDAVSIADNTQFGTLQQNTLTQCETLKDRVGLFDLKLADPNGTAFRGDIGINNLKYGMAYTPWLRTALPKNVTYAELDGAGLIVINGAAGVTLSSLASADIQNDIIALYTDELAETNPDPVLLADFEQQLIDAFGLYKAILNGLNSVIREVPPSGAVAGVMATVDRTRGVWKAPANVSLNSVVEPAVTFSNSELSALNIDTTAGKSINVIRSFTGKGTLIWGARTLAGNDNEWRYVPVRRFFNMVEESVKKATEQFVFEPNDANTWVKVRAMIENFLTLQWRAGALAGSKPRDAFFVRVALGETMTTDDILNGRMNVEIGMAVVRPAEFIILRFSHKMQEA